MLIWKSDMREVRTSSVKSSSTLFLFSTRAIYNRVHRAQNKCLMLKSYLPGINTSNFPKRHYDNILSEKLVNNHQMTDFLRSSQISRRIHTYVKLKY